MASFGDMLNYSVLSLRHRKLRTFLTIIGIVIGIAAIVSLVSIGQGLSISVDNQLKAFGARNVVVVPGDISKQFALSGGPSRPPAAGKLFDNDAKRIEKIPGAAHVTRLIQTRANLVYKDSAAAVSIAGVEPSLFMETAANINISSGRFLMDGDGRTAVIGSSLADKTVFKKEMQVGSIFTLGADNDTYRVVGILDKSGRSTSDMAMYIPIDYARDIAGDTLVDKEVSAIRYSVLEGYDLNETNSQVEAELASAHRVKLDDKDFSLVTSDSIMASVNIILGLITAFLGFVASISLVVGGVGVANTMFMSVFERTKEIGTMKAIGASNRDVLGIIMLESGMIGLAGGILGAALGYAISGIISVIGAESGFVTSTTPDLIVFSLAFSVVVGIVSGYMPAKQAAGLEPVVAMASD